MVAVVQASIIMEPALEKSVHKDTCGGNYAKHKLSFGEAHPVHEFVGQGLFKCIRNV